MNASRLSVASARVVVLSVALGLVAQAQDELPPPRKISPPKPTLKIEAGDLLEQAGMEPITFPKTSITRQEFNRQRYAFCQRKIVPAIQQELNSALDAPAKKATVDKLLSWWVGTAQAETAADAASLLKDLGDLAGPTVKAPVFQAIAADFISAMRKPEEGIARCRVTLENLDPSKSPGLAGIHAFVVLHGNSKERAAAAAAYSKNLPQYLASALSPAQCGEADAASVVAFLTAPRTANVLQPYAEHLLPICRDSKLPAWARQTMVGQCEAQLGWTTHGNGFMDPVTPAGFRVYKEHLDKARAAFAEAWKLKPDQPCAAVQMITIAMVGQAVAGETPRLWFDRATAAQCDQLTAYEKMRVSLRPNWGGSTLRMAAFGLACGLGHRPGSHVGEQFANVMQDLAEELPEWRKIIRDPHLARPLIETRQKLLAEAENVLGGTTQNGLLAIEAWLCGQPQIATAALEKVGDFRVPGTSLPARCVDALRQYGLNSHEFLMDCRLRGGKWGADYSKIVELRAAGKLAEASSQLATLLKDPVAREDDVLAGLLGMTDFEVHAGKSEWAKFPLQVSAWTAATHSWRLQASDIKILAAGPGSTMFYRGALGDRYEIRGEILPAKGRARTAFGFAFGAAGPAVQRAATFSAVSVDGKSAVFKISTPDDKTLKTLPTEKPWTFPEPAAPIPFRIRREADRISIWLGEQLVLDRNALATGLSSGPFAFALTAAGGTSEDPALIRHFEAKRLAAE